jgi:predicted DNA-binding WGR domain protein
MLDRFSAVLEARSPERGHFRSYRIEAGIDLLGDWLVAITYGRIGSPGRRVCHAFADEGEARRCVADKLHRRSSSQRRIGTEYRLQEWHDPWQWLDGTNWGRADRDGSPAG